MSVFNKVTDVLKELSGTDNIELEMTLQNDLALDSMAMVTLLIEIEDAFEIELIESDMNPFDLTTVQDVVNLVERYLGGENEEG